MNTFCVSLVLELYKAFPLSLDREAQSWAQNATGDITCSWGNGVIISLLYGISLKVVLTYFAVFLHY